LDRFIQDTTMVMEEFQKDLGSVNTGIPILNTNGNGVVTKPPLSWEVEERVDTGKVKQ
jgi:hypothetical protein